MTISMDGEIICIDILIRIKRIEKLETISQYEDAVRYTSSKVKIENWAKSGASVRSYYNDPKLFKNVYNRLRKGDYVLFSLDIMK